MAGENGCDERSNFPKKKAKAIVSIIVVVDPKIHPVHAYGREELGRSAGENSIGECNTFWHDFINNYD